MHIGYFSSILGRTGGPAIVDKRLIEAIAEHDHHNQYTVYGVTKQSTAGLRFNTDGNISIRTIKPSGKWLAIPFGLTLELKKRPVDLLHATIIAPPIVPCKYVFTITCWSQYSQPELYPFLIRYRLLYLINKGIKNAAAIFCYTEYLKNKLMEKFHIDPDRIFITQPAVGEEVRPVEDKEVLKTFLAGFGIDFPYILFIGSLTKRKNVEGLIRAYHILRQESKIEHKLVLLGEKGYFFEEIVKTVDELNLSDDIVFVDRRPYHELPMFYTGADVYVFPTFSEGFGLPPLEAMACGTPVVASNVTSVPEVVGDAAYMVDPYDSGSIAEGISQCLSNDQLRKSLIEKGLQRASEFTWARTAEQVVKSYESILEAGW